MSDHHDNHHPAEQKPVSFNVPLILASVFILIMVLLLSVCDPKHGGCECKEGCSKECMEKCESGDHSSHDEHRNEMKGAAHEEHATDEHHDMAKDSTATEHSAPVKDSTAEHHAH